MKKYLIPLIFLILSIIILLILVLNKKHSENYLRKFDNVNIIAKDYSPVLFQCFAFFNPSGYRQTYYNYLSKKIDDISKYNFILLPPLSSAGMNSAGYVPREWYNLNNSYGTPADQTKLLNLLNSVQTFPIADAVLNHRNGTTGWIDFTNPNLGNPLSAIVKSDLVWSKGPESCRFFRDGKEDIDGFLNYCNTNPCDDCCRLIGTNSDSAKAFRYDDTCDFPGECGGNWARELAHDNPDIRKNIRDYLKFMFDTGYKGLRLDFVKGFSAKWMREYLYFVKNNSFFNVGELFDGDIGKLKKWINDTDGLSRLYDFPLKFILNSAFSGSSLNSDLLYSNGTMPGLTGTDPLHSVTFIENHDTWHNKGMRFPFGREILGYIYILTHPGSPCVFLYHDDTISGSWCCEYDYNCEDFFCDKSYYYLREPLKKLISIRQQAKVQDDLSKIFIEKRPNFYACYIQGNAGSIAIKFGNDFWKPHGHLSYGYWKQIDVLCGNANGIGHCVWVSDNIQV